jgi:hypothetical protein
MDNPNNPLNTSPESPARGDTLLTGGFNRRKADTREHKVPQGRHLIND